MPWLLQHPSRVVLCSLKIQETGPAEAQCHTRPQQNAPAASLPLYCQQGFVTGQYNNTAVQEQTHSQSTVQQAGAYLCSAASLRCQQSTLWPLCSIFKASAGASAGQFTCAACELQGEVEVQKCAAAAAHDVSRSQKHTALFCNRKFLQQRHTCSQATCLYIKTVCHSYGTCMG